MRSISFRMCKTCGLLGRVSSIHSPGDGGINEACAVRLNTYMEARGCKAGAGLWNSVRVEEDMLLQEESSLIQCACSCSARQAAISHISGPLGGPAPLCAWGRPRRVITGKCFVAV